MGTRGAQSAEAGPRHSGRKTVTTAKYMLAIYLILKSVLRQTNKTIFEFTLDRAATSAGQTN